MSSSTCYWPNGGGVATGYTPCGNSTSGQYACCASTHYCFSNGLCLDNTEMTTYRGACTDKTWKSAACAQYCITASNGGLYDGVCGVWVCNNDNQFSCDSSTCGNSSEMFDVSGGTIQRNVALDSILSATTSTASTSSTSSASATSSTQATSSTANATTSPLADSVCPSHTGALAGLGAGLGIPLLIALIALGVLFMQLRKHKKQNTVAAAPQTEQKHYTNSPSATLDNGHGNGYYSPSPAYKPPMQTGAELPTSSGHDGRPELDGTAR